MFNSKLQQLLFLTKLGGTTGQLTFNCRQKKLRCENYEQQILEWRSIFHLGEVMTMGIAAMAFVFMDFCCLLQTYRTLSELVTGDADLLLFPIGIGFNILGLVVSDRLVKCSTSGPFYNWQLWKLGGKNTDAAIYDLEYHQSDRRREFRVNMFIYLAMIFALVGIRYVLLEGSGSKVESAGWLLSLLGFLFSIFAVTIGVYLIPLFQYVSWSSKVSILKRQMKASIRKVAALDDLIYNLWVQLGMPLNVSQDIKEALVRFLFRTKSMDYCDSITSEELNALLATQRRPSDSVLLENETDELINL